MITSANKRMIGFKVKWFLKDYANVTAQTGFLRYWMSRITKP